MVSHSPILAIFRFIWLSHTLWFKPADFELRFMVVNKKVCNHLIRLDTLGATAKLPTDKQATGRDAEGVTGAEMRNDPMLTIHPMGVAASVVAAARLNQQKNDWGVLWFSS
ncbi:hypothetical protein Ddye_025420 [Dipteronia dyeriana]|uniref:SMP domain-containing protein n=1 Tax=Dipteronia dyeriana TaxID=168575 RepID=A0AAD9TK67_9ROSI|nr:hypothetical protein Ddye_025420 [Dipteronia dyeriana]